MLLLFLSTWVGAQQPPPFGGPNEEMIPERARERVELLLKWKVIEVLNLDEEQSNKIFPLYTKLRQSRREYTMERMRIIQELKQLLVSDADKADIEKSLSQLDDFDRAFNESREEMLASLKANLTLEQWARYLIFEAEFPREIRNMMRDRGGFGPKPRRRNW
jgi:Spy/CpxP family protein refolding chaperone